MLTMKAIGARQFLPVSDPAFMVGFDAPMPVPGPMDLRVRVHAVAVNPVDTKIRASLGEIPQDPPRILGWDAAGVVEAVGADVAGFAPGDEVFYAGDLSRAGSNAEFQSVDFRLVARKPVTWTFEQSAAVPLAALTAWELLFERMGADPGGKSRGGRLLVINGAGGVGSALIPLARHAGLEVVATASRPETRAWCLSLGANHVINHREPLRPQVEQLGIRSFPYIANLFNTEAYWDCTADLIAPFGTLGLIVEPRVKLHIGDPLKAKCVRIAWEFMAARSRFQSPDMHLQGRHLADIAALCDAGIFPHIHTRILDHLTVENLRLAHRAMEEGQAHGKWVIHVP
jgi:NADPH2:quinone reductase